MSKAECDANEVLKLQAEIEYLQQLVIQEKCAAQLEAENAELLEKRTADLLAERDALRKAVGRCVVALEYAAGEFAELGEDDDMALMEKRAEQARAALAEEE